MAESERIRQACEILDINIKELSNEVGVSYRTLQNYLGGKSKLGSDFLVAIHEKYGISSDWLLTGKGNIFHENAKKNGSRREAVTTDSKTENTSQESETLASKAPSGEELIEIPQLDVSFSAGYGSYPDDHTLAIGSRPFSGKWIRNKGLKPENLALVRVHGDSMEPLLKDKDMVMLDQSVNTPITTMPVAFRLDGELYIKLCQNDGKGNLAMISVNKVYDPIIIDKESPPPDFAIIAAVVWHAHSWI